MLKIRKLNTRKITDISKVNYYDINYLCNVAIFNRNTKLVIFLTHLRFSTFFHFDTEFKNKRFH